MPRSLSVVIGQPDAQSPLFNIIPQLKLTEQEEADLTAYMRCL
jgi:hypothetical protein